MTLEGANDREKLTTLCKKTYKEQAIWFLNASWETSGQGSAEDLWKYVHKANELDLQKKNAGSEFDELNMHRFLESFKNERTVKELRDELRKVGVDNFKFIPLTMFLIWHYRFDWHKLVHASQGDNAAAIAKASAMLEHSQAACDEALRLANEATASEKAAKARAAEAEKAEADLKKADDELAAALAELKAQEDAFNNKTEDLKRKSEEGSTVQRNKAANELAQHLASDPLPLRKAKTTTEAAKRKAEKARAPFAEATAKAQAAADAAEAARQAAEDAVEEARRQVQEAEDYLEEQKRTVAAAGQGTLWWLDRELQEQKKYMPQSKGGIVKK